jgi:hypothetical protein
VVEEILVTIKYVPGLPIPPVEQNVADLFLVSLSQRRPITNSITSEAVIGYCSLEK